MAKDDRKSARQTDLRSKIQSQIDRQKEEQKLELLRRRIETAKVGLKAYEQQRYGEAFKAFMQYFHILEQWKDVKTGGLLPSHFDAQKDMAELLLINSIYWDLCLLADKSKNLNKNGEFKHYLEKFVLFTKGMRFEPLAAETLRKFLRNRSPTHRSEFKSAYKKITGSNCFVATSMIDVIDEETLPRLRIFRDGPLSRSKAGRIFCAWYENQGPVLARGMDLLPQPIRRALGTALDGIARVCSKIQ